jgi:hypothetical protein
MSVCPSVRPSLHAEKLGSYWMDFREILYLDIFRKSVEKIQDFFSNLTRKTGTLRENLYTFLSYLAHFFLE